MIKIGNCGWSYLNARRYFGNDWNNKFLSKLQAYAGLFDLVEINSTFYKIPKTKTAERWREEVDEINPGFEFTVKAPQIITHRDRFSSNKSFEAFEQIKEICKTLKAKILVFQSPASFKPNNENIKAVNKFFNKIDREGLIFVWEVRWERDWKKDIVTKVFSALDLNQCVDPLRQDCFFCKNLLYYRLHGFGRPMYNYTFTDDELEKIKDKSMSKKPVYVLFNNVSCYEDALRFKKILNES